MKTTHLFTYLISIMFCQSLLASNGTNNSDSLALQLKNKPEWNRLDIQQVNREPAHANSTPYAKHESKNRISLNGTWKFNWAETPEQRPIDFWKNDYKVDGWDNIQVPANWELNGYGRPYYVNMGYVFKMQQPFVPHKENHVGSYRRNFELPNAWEKRQVFVNFGAVESAFYIWVNGKKVGYSQGGKTPAEFNLTDYVQQGNNTISVEVYRWNDGSYLEDVDAWRLSGISRDVTLYSTANVRLRDYFIKAGLSNNYTRGELNLDVDVMNHNVGSFSGSAKITLSKNDQPIFTASHNIKMTNKNHHSLIQFKENVANVLSWSAESPSLYQLSIQLLDENNQLIDSVIEDIGFRSVEISKGQLLVNGKAIKLKGVNRHEHDYKTGHVVSRKAMEDDIALMKKFNVNAVRTSHYPNDPYWYKLADKHGLYVVDEAYIESHGYMNERTSLGNQPEWEKSHMTRMQTMVERDKNHPSIIIWSLGNEANGGSSFKKMYDWTRERDPTRFVQYQAAGLVDYTDIYVPFYRTPEDVKRYMEGEPLKPLIHSEYMHAMGNSLGGFQKHWDVINKYSMAQGGFIWDWFDQGLLTKNKEGIDFFAYGGDFGPQQVDGASPPKKELRGNFLANGIFQANRQPNPHAWEMKKVFQPFVFSSVNINELEFSVTNSRYFTSTEDMKFEWVLREDGKQVHQSSLKLPIIDANKTHHFKVKLPQIEIKAGSEYFLTIEARTKKSGNSLLKKNHLVAWEQFQLPWKVKSNTINLERYSSLKLKQSDKVISISGQRFNYKINAKTGKLFSLNFDNVEMLRTELEANFWRPLTDNDIGGMLHETSKQWKKAHTKFKKKAKVKVEKISDTMIDVTVSRHNGDRFVYQTKYSIYASGDILVNSSLRPIADHGRDLLRFGMTMTLPEKFNQLKWYGRGPHESYSDRLTSAPIGLYSGSVWEQYHPYARPQETGNKTDVRWMALSDKKGYGLLVKGNPTFSGSALQLANSDLYFKPNESKHGATIKPKNFVTLNIDKRQIGVGGDDSWSVKALAKKEHRLPFQFYRQQFYLRPFAPDENIEQLVIQKLPKL